jgi:hypothetical protein
MKIVYRKIFKNSKKKLINWKNNLKKKNKNFKYKYQIKIKKKRNFYQILRKKMKKKNN